MQSITLWRHQVAAIEAARHRKNYALFFEQGTGKTATLIHIHAEKCAQQGTGLLSTLILCPQIVVENWRREFLAHSEVADSDIVCLSGSGKQRAKALEAILGGRPRIVITNYEALNMPAVFDLLMRLHSQVLVLDESHKCKDVSAKRTKRAIQLSALALYRYILSGTPIVNSAFDIYSQFLIMDAGATFGDNFREFRSRYFIDENAGRSRQSYFPAWQPKIEAFNQINDLINRNAARVRKAECLDLPPLVKQVVEIDLDGEQARYYRDMEKDCVAGIGDGVSSADLAISQALRLQQITSGHLRLDDGSLKVFLPNPRITAAREIISQIPASEKIIIWATFRADYAVLRAMVAEMGERCVEVTGETPGPLKQYNVDEFNRRGGPRIFIGHPASAGIGVNLTSASYAIFFSRNFSLENDLQAEARNYRGGSEIHSKVTRIDIVARGTVDELVLHALSEKQNVSDFLIEKLKGKSCNRA